MDFGSALVRMHRTEVCQPVPVVVLDEQPLNLRQTLSLGRDATALGLEVEQVRHFAFGASVSHRYMTVWRRSLAR
jgi:hypothetical protein